MGEGLIGRGHSSCVGPAPPVGNRLSVELTVGVVTPCSEMASLGQTVTQVPHSRQRDRFTAGMLLSRVSASSGHARTHTPQPVHLLTSMLTVSCLLFGAPNLSLDPTDPMAPYPAHILAPPPNCYTQGISSSLP